MATTYDAIVVGGGMAGLTAAAFLRKSGKTVLLLEKNDHCGGLVRSFSRMGFTYDAGVRALLDSGIIFPMLRELGLELEVSRSKVSVGIEGEFVGIEAVADLDDYERLLGGFYPDSVDDVKRIIAVVRRIMKDMDVLYGVENPMFRDLLHDREYLFRTLLPWLLKFAATIGRIYRLGEPVEDFLGRLTDNPSLRDIICQHFFRKTPTFFAMSYFSLYLDYLYPPGGTGMLAARVEAFNRERGTVVRENTRVVGIDPAARTVRDEAGEAYGYRELLWAADAKTLYEITEGERIEAGSRRRRFYAKKNAIEGHRGGDSVFTLFLGVDLPPERFSAVSNGHLFYTPDRRGLNGIHTTELDALLERLRRGIEADKTAGSPPAGAWPASGAIGDGAERKSLVEDWLRKFFAFTSYEVSIPVLRDPSMAPAGKTGLIISVLFEHELCRLVELDGWYDEFKALVEDSILSVIGSKLYPGLAGRIVDRFSSSPLTIEREVGTANGAITGWAFTGGRLPAVQKIQRSTKAIYTPIPHVFQAGQWSYSPAGVPIAVLTGKLAADGMGRALRRALRRPSSL